MAGLPPMLLSRPHLGVQREATHPSSLMIAQAAGYRCGGAEALGQWLQRVPVYHLPPPKMWELFQVHGVPLQPLSQGFKHPRNRTAEPRGTKHFPVSVASRAPDLPGWRGVALHGSRGAEKPGTLVPNPCPQLHRWGLPCVSHGGSWLAEGFREHSWQGRSRMGGE